MAQVIGSQSFDHRSALTSLVMFGEEKRHLLTLVSTGPVSCVWGRPKLLNLGINLKHGGAGRARFRGKQAYLFVLKEVYAPETPCISGSGAGGEAVDSFTSGRNRLFYPQIAHALCISHTVPLWTAWN